MVRAGIGGYTERRGQDNRVVRQRARAPAPHIQHFRAIQREQGANS